ncbi:MAG: ABC transporter ATP-binding protein [Acidobacteria bacterium]|nr:ABC transporter ATP-binding protein [Acidobacteriota bacterium]
MKSEHLLRLVGISKSFGARRVVDALSLEVLPGELFCILGPSGCGKTTLLRMIAGLETPDEGSIELDGQLVVDQGKARLTPQERVIGFVFQDLALWPHLTVAGNLDFVLHAKKISRPSRQARIREVLNRVHLSEFEGAYPETLSGGEQQRLAIARALVSNPSLVLLDEPLSSLDYRLRLQLRQELLCWLRELKVTALLITHDQNEAFALADRLAIMNQGRLVQVGTPEEVRKYSLDPFVQGFLIGLSRVSS